MLRPERCRKLVAPRRCEMPSRSLNNGVACDRACYTRMRRLIDCLRAVGIPAASWTTSVPLVRPTSLRLAAERAHASYRWRRGLQAASEHAPSRDQVRRCRAKRFCTTSNPASFSAGRRRPVSRARSRTSSRMAFCRSRRFIVCVYMAKYASTSGIRRIASAFTRQSSIASGGPGPSTALRTADPRFATVGDDLSGQADDRSDESPRRQRRECRLTPRGPR